MQILFLHDNFPAQFGVFGQYLVRNGWEVWYGTQRKGSAIEGLKVFNYEPHRKTTPEIHQYAAGFERAILNGQAVARTAIQLKQKGLNPDIVVAHSGWGPGLFAKDIWPDAKYVGYFEWYYRADAPDLTFISDGEQLIDDRLRARARNAAILMDLAHCDAAICPTSFQKSQFPACFQGKLSTIHDGIRTDYFSPEPGARLSIPNLDLTGVDELITYVARGMEPYRGFNEFIASLEIILKERPNAHAVIVGEDRVAYGKKLPEGDSFKKRALAQFDLDWERVHFTGLLPWAQYRDVLLASSVHVYLTVPFVLSWSMMEAMSAGCAIVGSDVAPVREIADQSPGCIALVDMKDPTAIAACVSNLLEDRKAAQQMGQSARKLIVSKYSVTDIYAKKARWLTELAGSNSDDVV